MPIKPTTPKEALERSIYKRIALVKKQLLQILYLAGEKVVKYARELPSPSLEDFPSYEKNRKVPPHQPHYIDWTANLRSSIGYVVLDDGQVIAESDFSPLSGERGTSGVTGAKEGKEFIEKLARENGNGLVLIIVAGMPYAAYVEAKGYDVLGSAEDEAERIVKRLLSKIKF